MPGLLLLLLLLPGLLLTFGPAPVGPEPKTEAGQRVGFLRRWRPSALALDAHQPFVFPANATVGSARAQVGGRSPGLCGRRGRGRALQPPHLAGPPAAHRLPRQAASRWPTCR